MRIVLQPFALAAAWLSVLGCGDSTNMAGTSASQKGSANANKAGDDNDSDSKADTGKFGNGSDIGNSKYSHLTWFWQCESAQVPLPPAASPKDFVIEGSGPHQFKPDDLDGSDLVFAGKICEPQDLMRDIVFVVDTSGSMNENDPRTGNTCGRYKAIDAVLSTLPADGTAKMGLVTFNTLLDRNSAGLFGSGQDLFANLSATGTVADVICNAVGGTNYVAGLTKASEILASAGRPNATKEIYFISDGQPNPGVDGVALANQLKTVGVSSGGKTQPVTIATIMLAGTDTVLEKYIASRGADGKPLHAYVAQTPELTKALGNLVDNEIVGAELSWRPVGTSDWTTTDLLTVEQGFSFILPSIKMSYEDSKQGIEVHYEYYDKHDNRFSTGGELLWIAASDSKDKAKK